MQLAVCIAKQNYGSVSPPDGQVVLLFCPLAGSVTISEFDPGSFFESFGPFGAGHCIPKEQSRPRWSFPAASIFLMEIRVFKFSVLKAAVWQQHMCFGS